MTTNDYPTTPDERALLAWDVHAHLPEDRRVQIHGDGLERLAAGLPDHFTADETAAALCRWVAPDDFADVPWTTSRAGFDAVMAARARGEDPRGVFETYDPRSRAGAITGQRRAQGMRLGEVSFTETTAFGLADTAVKRVKDVPRFAAEALRRERRDEVDVRTLESGALRRAAGRVQTRYYPTARIHVR